MNKIIKIVGIWVAAEVIFALGKGHMLANVRRFDPETGDEIRKCLEDAAHKEGCPIALRASGAVISKADDFMTWLYAEQEKGRKTGERG
jgi:hypothetical protein